MKTMARGAPPRASSASRGPRRSDLAPSDDRDRDLLTAALEEYLDAARERNHRCGLCHDRKVLQVTPRMTVPCVCTPDGRLHANGRGDAEVLRELAGEEAAP